VQRIDFGTALPVILETYPHRQREPVGKVSLERLFAGDLAPDVADHAAQPDAQKFKAGASFTRSSIPATGLRDRRAACPPLFLLTRLRLRGGRSRHLAPAKIGAVKSMGSASASGFWLFGGMFRKEDHGGR